MSVQKVRFIHRDVNGAFNIRKVGLYEILGQDRPKVFQSQSVTPQASYRTVKLPVGKIVSDLVDKPKKKTIIRKISEKTVLAKEMVKV